MQNRGARVNYSNYSSNRLIITLMLRKTLQMKLCSVVFDSRRSTNTGFDHDSELVHSDRRGRQYLAECGPCLSHQTLSSMLLLSVKVQHSRTLIRHLITPGGKFIFNSH